MRKYIIFLMMLLLLSSVTNAYLDPIGGSDDATDYLMADSFDRDDANLNGQSPTEGSGTWVATNAETKDYQGYSITDAATAGIDVTEYTGSNNTVGMWMKVGATTAGSYMYARDSTTDLCHGGWRGTADDNLRFFRPGGDGYENHDGSGISQKLWHYWVIVHDNVNNQCSYHIYDNDGTLVFSLKLAEINAGVMDNVYTYFINNNVIAWRDNVSSWNGDVSDIPPPISDPVVALVAPATANISARDVNLTFSISTATIDTGCTLYHNGTGTWAANLTYSEGTIETHDLGRAGFGAGNYLWGVKCVDGGTDYWSTTNNTLTIDLESPTIAINTANCDFTTGTTYTTATHANPYNDSLRIYIDLSDDRDLYAFYLNVTDKDGNNVYSNGSSSLSGTSYSIDRRLNTSSWSDGIYKVTVNASDSHTAKYIKPYANYARNKQLEYLTQERNHIWIESDDNAVTKTTKHLDRYDFEFRFSDGETKERTFHIRSDTPITYLPYSSYKAHFIVSKDGGVTGNWIDFEGVKGTPTIIEVSEYHYMVVFDNLSPEVKFNSLGGLNTNSEVYWFYQGKYFVLPANTSLEGGSVTLQTNITYNHNFIQGSPRGNVTYNGTVYQQTDNFITNLGDNYYQELIEITFTAPDVASTYYYNWNYVVDPFLAVLLDLRFSGATSTHNVLTWLLDDCTAQSSKVLTFANHDEQNPFVQNNVTFEIDVSYWDVFGGVIKNYSKKLTDSKNLTLCISPTKLYADIYLKYTNPHGFTHRYYLYNDTLYNTTNKFINVYNFNTTTGVSDLRVTARNINTYQYFINAIVSLERYYPGEDIWRNVQMGKTDDYGFVFFNIIEEGEDYRLVFKNTNNQLLKITEELTFSCDSGVCTIIALLAPYSEGGAGNNVSVSYVFNNNTNILNINWVSGFNAGVTARITQETSRSSTEICNGHSVGYSGSYQCNLSGYTGTAWLSINSSYLGTDIFNFGTYITLPETKLGDYVGVKEGAFYGFAIMVVVVMFGIWSPVACVISALFGLIIIFYLGLVPAITLPFLIIAVILGTVLSLKLGS